MTKICSTCGDDKAKKYYGKGEPYACHKCYLKANQKKYQENRKEKYAEDPEYRAKTNASTKATVAKMKEEGWKRAPRLRADMTEAQLERSKVLKAEYRARDPERANAINRKSRNSRYARDPNPVRERNEAFKRTLAGQYSHLKASARRRGIAFLLTIEEYEDLRSRPCYYSGEPLPDTGGCIDRLDSNLPYELSNCVPCIPMCNYLKADLLTPEQTKRAYLAYLFVRGGGEPPKAKSRFTGLVACSKGYTKLRIMAHATDRALSLTKSEYEELVRWSCHYCGGPLPENGYGLDRKVSSDQFYTRDNVVPCCRRCNDVKGDILSEGEMLAVAEVLDDE